MEIACLGGGPGGLYFAISMKLRNPEYHIDVFERNKKDDTFGWGVVLSAETLVNLTENDPASSEEIRKSFVYWDDVAVMHKGERSVSSGHGFCGVGRKKMLLILQQRAQELGVNLHYETEIDDIEKLKSDYDLLVACDGINSGCRSLYAEHFEPELDVRTCKFVWLGTHQKFDDAFSFIFEETKHGWIWAHAYQFDDDMATFIVECSEATWQGFGFGDMNQQESIAICEEIFKDHLGTHKLMTNSGHIRGSAWLNFTRVICKKWYHENIVLLGDSSATAHFSIGSGTKLALESAIALSKYLSESASMEEAFEQYQQERRLDVLRLQSAARNSTEWFENLERYLSLDPVQFNYSLLTRSQRISHENLRLRDPDWVQAAETWFQGKSGVNNSTRAPMFAPFKLREMSLVNRIVVSPMAQYKAKEGTPTDWHFSHYAERAKGGAGLITTEMTCVSADARITPACTGLYKPEHEAAWRRLTDFVHQETKAKISCQLGHAGRKGSTQLGWEEMDAPLREENWDIISASAIAWSADNQTPREMSREDMDRVTAQFVAAAQMADRAGFDMIELHAAHGYLLSSFISPISNHRADEYGGHLENRLRYPLEVFESIRAVWPDEKPISVRISATDWLDGAGVDASEGVEIAKIFCAVGADMIDVSAGQTSKEAKPIYGRMFQTPLSDRIKNTADVKTMAVGNIYEPDHVNSILMAGRADLVCLARPHLADPYWTLHAAALLGDTETVWPRPYEAGRDQLYRLAERNES